MKKSLVGLSNNVHLNSEKIELWVNSFRKVSSDDIVLLLANGSKEDIEICNKFNIKIKPVLIEDDGFINHKRLEHTLNFIKESEYDFFIITDVFDVVFQKNPFDKLDVFNYDIFVGGEGININQEPWNSDNINKLFPKYLSVCAPNEIINSGVIAGKKGSLISLYQRMFELCEESPNSHNIKDQAALNVLVWKNEVKNLKIFNLDDGWVVHCAVAGPTQFFESWGFKNNLKYGIPKINGNVVVTNENEVFDIVHQFNRVPDWHNKIKNNFIL